MESQFPKMVEVRQTHPPSPRLNFSQLLDEQFASTGIRKEIVPGMRIAVGVGSRGIANLKEMVKTTIDLLTAAGAHPFVVPAMGCHGGATPEGQAEVLAEYGITEESVGVPIETGMAVEKIGTALDGHDVVFSVTALHAYVVVFINRIKPHTDFRGPARSSGILRRCSRSGFGKQEGAA